MNSKNLQIGVDTFKIQRFSPSHPNNVSLTYYTYLPNEINNATQIMFVMHGKDRNAMDYLDAWKDFADANNFLVVAPEFPELENGETFDYQEGNVWNEKHVWNKKEDWAFSTIERIFDQVKVKNTLIADSFFIFGHSAGAQFVHRMLTFLPESRIKCAFAANAGWYTFPDFELKYPYGLKNTPVSEETLNQTFAKPLFILLGKNDIDDENLRKTGKAVDQGKTRLERGNNYFKFCEDIAKQIKCSRNWDKKIIEDADHNYIIMSKAAQGIILGH